MKPQFGPEENGASDAKVTAACGAAEPSKMSSGGAVGANHESESIHATVEKRASARAIAAILQ